MSTSPDPEAGQPVPVAPGAVPVPTSADAPSGRSPSGVAGVLALYTLARAGLLAVIAGLLLLAGTPLVISVLVGLIVALPLSMLLFRGLRSRLDSALAIARARRAEQRGALRAGLRGDPDAPAGLSGDRPERQPDGGGA